jgi:hypothetical protein
MLDLRLVFFLNVFSDMFSKHQKDRIWMSMKHPTKLFNFKNSGKLLVGGTGSTP